MEVVAKEEVGEKRGRENEEGNGEEHQMIKGEKVEEGE